MTSERLKKPKSASAANDKSKKPKAPRKPPAPGEPLSKKELARRAGDAARAAGVVDNFRPSSGKDSGTAPVPGKRTPPGTGSGTVPVPGNPGKRGATESAQKRPGRPAPLEVRIMRLDEDGVGVGRAENRDILIAGAYPGEEVEASVSAKGQYRIIGRLRKVLQKHPHRINGGCRSLGDCQNCPLINLDAATQAEIKETRVRAAFSRYPALREAAVAPLLPAPERLGYRTNAKLVFGRQRGKLQLGLYRRGSHDIVDLDACPLHHPLINRIAQAVREEVEKLQIYVYDSFKKRGLLRYLLIRVSPATGKAMVTFVVAERDFKQLNVLAKWLQRKVPEVISVQQNVNASTGNVILGRDTLRLTGTPDLFDQVGDVRLQLSPASFFQVNHSQAARIYALVREWADLQKNEVAIDLYCGIGGIALHLARDAGRVCGIETVEEAIRNARANARLNNLDNCVFIAGDAEDLVDDLPPEFSHAEVVVLNPPRSGCEESVLDFAAGIAPRTLIYVSCNPETLARDLDILCQKGYAVVAVQPVDMFPQTAHVETVVRLERR